MLLKKREKNHTLTRYFNTVSQLTAKNKQGFGRAEYNTTSKSDLLNTKMKPAFFLNKGYDLKINHVLGVNQPQ